jgi:aromatic ring-cleaving dioxygenase
MADKGHLTTTASFANVESIKAYHVHIYYDPALTRDCAARLRERLAATFPDAKIGPWHDHPVGPHLQPMFRATFPHKRLASLLPWLMLNRDGLTVLLHPETGQAYADHTDHAVWLGGVLPLKLDSLRAANQG